MRKRSLFFPFSSFLMKMPDDERNALNVTLRDLFFAASQKLLSDSEIQLFKSVVALVKEEQPLVEIQGLRVSYYPTEEFKLVRFFEFETDSELLACVSGMRMGFVNSAELHFRCFENIIPLDRSFGKLDLQLTDVKSLHKVVGFVLTCISLDL
jgi:hypothetical protein